MAKRETKKNGTHKSRKREIAGFLLIVVSVFILVALTTHNPADWPGSSREFGEPTHNLTGRYGAWLSHVAFEKIGFTGFAVTLILGYAGVILFMHRSLREMLKPSALMLSVGVFLPLLISIVAGIGSGMTIPEANASYGGVLGVFMSYLMVTYLGRLGAFLVALTVIMVTVVLTTSLKPSTILEYMIAGTKSLAGSAAGAAKRSAGNRKRTNSRKRPPESVSAAPVMPPIAESDYGDDPFLTPVEDAGEDTYDVAPLPPIPEPEIQFPEPRVIPMPTDPETESDEESEGRVDVDDFLSDGEYEGSEDPDAERAEAARKAYRMPGIELLDPQGEEPMPESREEMLDKAQRIVESLRHFNVDAEVKQITPGPIVTRYELTLAPGIKVGRILSLSDDLAMALKARGAIRILAPIPGKAAVGIEVPNRSRATVYYREIVESEPFRENPQPLLLALGKNTAGEPIVADLARMPHLLIAGSTGSGKSVCINSIVASILMKARPDAVRMIMVDPKVVELSIYNNIPHLMTPVVTDSKRAEDVLKWAVREMETRYRELASFGVRDIIQYNIKITRMREEAATEGNENIDVPDALPYMVIIIDEFADLMVVASNEIEEYIARLAQMARAVGIHLVLATQRPSADVITGLIKANFPSRIAFKVMQASNSRIILDQNGADKLLGLGDMLFLQVGKPEPVRIHGAFISNEESQRIADFASKQQDMKLDRIADEIFRDDTEGENNALGLRDPSARDALFYKAARLVTMTNQGSVSLLQRRLKIGYARAARLIDQLELAGIVGSYDGSKAREVLVDETYIDEMEESGL